eukprot:TRINITY_DN1316_c0_g1_i1.p1 TRINITY_DN1316_c0_g1~~TRINITY_DN1316_c0_g1_i1.p1  ORF type:complete len:811 (-),score=150.36 TRINITY_DN1316_c0_g1_i1:24-2126(-)
MAATNKLWVNLRIGPYICGEWNYGGFPEWLKEVPDMVFRDFNDPFMAAMATWMTFITKYLEPYFASNGGPIILVQVENEYGWLEAEYGLNGTKYAQWAIDFAHTLDVGVPWIMCAQNNIDNAINTCNGFYCDDWIEGHWAMFPNQPAFWTENWPGWFQNWGNPKQIRPPADIAFSVARFFARGGSLVNYYMWQGGTNFARWSGGPNIVTSYDYDAPLDEYGWPNNPKCSSLAQLHTVLHEIEDTLLLGELPKNQSLGPNQYLYLWQTDTQYAAFISNMDTENAFNLTFKGQEYIIPKWSLTIIAPNLVYNTADLVLEYKQHKPKPKQQPQLLGNFVSYREPVGLWNGTGVYNPTPLEQVTFTHDKTDYMWYVADVNATADNTYNITISNTQDYFYIYFDGNLAGINVGEVQVTAIEGIHQIQILVLTQGLVNWGSHMEQWTRGLMGSVTWNGVDITSNGWHMQAGLQGEAFRLFDADGKQVDWDTTEKDAIDTPLTWIKYTFDVDAVPDPNINFAVNLNSMGKGYAYLNGRGLGRYWSEPVSSYGCPQCDYAGPYSQHNCAFGCGLPAQRYYNVPVEWFQPTNNTLLLIEEIGGDPTQVALNQLGSSYECATSSEETGDMAFIQCDPGTYISTVEFASYGQPSGNCGAYYPDTCNALNSTEVVTSLCVGKSYCSPWASTEVFGDPCPGLNKWLSIAVICS